MGDMQLETLADAIARNSAAVLSLPSAGMLRHHKSRFLAQTAEGIWIESAPGESPLIDSLLEQKVLVGVSFKAPPNKSTFAVPILRRDPAFKLNADSAVAALLLQNPTKIKPVQRRNNFRVQVPDGAPLQVRMWRITDHAVLRDRPLASTLVAHQVRNLSVGGMGVTIRPDTDEPRPLHSSQRLRVEIKSAEIELILDGMLRAESECDTTRAFTAGVQFKKMENDIAGRQAMAALTRIVGEFQQEEVRRSRLAS